MSLDFDDLLGSEDEDLPVAGHGRDFSMKMNTVHMVANHGVTIPWLVQAFSIPRNRVERMLTGCPVERLQKNGGKIYDFATAAAYLVKPRVNIREYLESLEPKDMPERLRSEYWRARMLEQKARKEAGTLWRDEDVQEAFGEIFKLIKDTAILWTDTLDETTGLTDEQVGIVDNLVHQMLSQIGDTVANYARTKRTASQLAELDEGDDVA